MSNSSAKHIDRETLTVFTVAILLTILLLVFAFRSSTAPVKRTVYVSSKDTPALLRQKKTDAVCQELLKRDDVSLPVLRDCLLCLAKSRRTSDLNVLLQLIQTLPDESPFSAQQNLSHVLSDMTVAQQQQAGEKAAEWSPDELSTPARQIVAAMDLAVSKDRIDLSADAEDKKQWRQNLLLLPLIPSVAVQESYYADVRLLLDRVMADRDTPSPESHRLLIETTGRMRGRDTDRAHDLMKMILSDQYSSLAIASLNRIPAAPWPEDKLGYLAAAVIAFIVDADDETERQIGLALADKIADRLPEEKRFRFTQRLAELRGN